MTNNKDHWYDGWFYDKIIAPNQDNLFREIKKIIESNASIIDVGCGTGRFSFTIANSVSKVVGVDLSSKNITTANQTLQKNPNNKISFHHTNLSELISQKLHFDYAVMTYVIHEVNPEDRIELLKQMACIADRIIIGDYIVPVNKGFWNLINEIVEFLAGKEHYNNFLNFVANNGLYGLIDKAGLKIVQEINNKPVTSQLLVLSK
ncbi:MAG: class I SAM-dependent methyltransferase [Ignavibacteria bacterium]|nr:class I SAM-dependent methyltransferase [Ignavibacteria bacterium]